MAIVKMKKLQIIGLLSDRESLMKRLQSLGCVEIIEHHLTDEERAQRLFAVEADSNASQMLDRVSRAMSVLDNYIPIKTPLFTQRPELTEAQLFDNQLLNSTLQKADRILSMESEIKEEASAEAKAESEKVSLLPWLELNVPLQMERTGYTEVRFGVCPGSIDFGSIKQRLQEEIHEAELYLASSDREQHYMLLIVYRDREEDALNLLRSFGWSAASLRCYTDTAKVNIIAAEKAAEKHGTKRQKLTSEVCTMASYRDELKLAYDRLTQDVRREETMERLFSTQKSFYLQGWVTVPTLERVEKLLSEYDCAYEMSEPLEKENVPIKLKNNRLTEPLNMVTEMYSLPAYDSVDPNPLILPFFTLFFGLMYADIGYGIILTVLSLVVTNRFKPRGTIGRMMRLATLCGITTTFWGLLFGSFFGDAVPVLCDLLGIERIELWRLIDPLEQPMVMLAASLGLGAVHLICGMAINAVLLIRDGKALDALFDVGSWWLLFAGIALGALGVTWWVCIAGVVALVLTQGRLKPTVAGKMLGGIASLYDITSYLGDILSYTRLMALLLASSVISGVVNVLGSLSGSIIVFVVVFLIGHAFNMGINIIGTYVHAARLQYLEYFGKFYKDGGRAFAPLSYKTKYIDMTKGEV